MIRPYIAALCDLAAVLVSKKKKYGNATKSELEVIGFDLGIELSKLLSDEEQPSITKLFVDAARVMHEKEVPRFGIIVVGSTMYKALRQHGFNHGLAQKMVDMWDLHMDHVASGS